MTPVLREFHENMNEPRRWRPSPFVLATLLLHLLCLVGLALRPGLWPWILGVLVINHIAVLAAVLWPRGSLLGPNMVRLPESAALLGQVTLTFDDGPNPDVTPKVLDLLDQYQAKASFFCIGKKAAAHPDIVREIAQRGHSVENHSYRHSWAFALYGFSRLRREVEATQSVIADITGQPPSYIRAPAGFRSPLLDAVLARLGMFYVSWTRRGFDTVNRNPSEVLQRLLRGLAPGDILLLHDGSYVRTDAGEPIALAVLPALLDQLATRGLKSVSLPTACNKGLPMRSTVATAAI